jgi:hypothetical protein
MKKDLSEAILALQNWYQQYCDGDWEHNTTINIHTIDNPGWRVTIDLEGTHCENQPFEDITKEITEDNWCHCFLREGKFEGAGGPRNLINILLVFLDWAQACQKKNL